MCGIAGFSLSAQDREAVDPTVLASELLTQIEARGRDATGVAWRNEDTREVWVQKAALPATEFVQHLEPIKAHTAILHARYATHGSPDDNDNNHPIDVAGVVGVHNGVLRNYRELFAAIGEEPSTNVDSEAVFALIRSISRKHLLRHLGNVRGSAAIAWLNSASTKWDVLHLARIQGSPLVVAQTERDSVLFASEAKHLTRVAEKLNLEIDTLHHVPEGTYLKVQQGTVIAADLFDVKSKVHYVRPNYDRPSRFEDVEVSA